MAKAIAVELTEVVKRRAREAGVLQIDDNAKLTPIAEELGAPKELQEEVPLYIVTNRDEMFGAPQVFKRGVVADIQGTLHSKEFFMIPCSVHEVLVYAKNATMPAIKAMVDTIRDINRTELRPEEKLSDELYLYNGNEFVVAD